MEIITFGMTIKIIAQNRRAYFQYHIEDTLEAGLVLTGTEIKSLREGRASLADAYALIKNGEVFLVHAHIPPFGPAGNFNHAPRRPRKLLLKKQQIGKLAVKLNQRGFTLIP